MHQRHQCGLVEEHPTSGSTGRRAVTVGAERVAAALDDVARYGPFFAIRGGADTHQVTRFFSFAELDDPAARCAREQAMERLASRSGATELRPIASLVQMSVAAQLCSPALATAAAHGLVPQLEVPLVRYGFVPSGAVRVLLPAVPAGIAGPTEELVDALSHFVTDGPLAAFTTALGAPAGLPPRTSGGNVASVLAAGALVLRRSAGGVVGDRALELVTAALATTPLRGTGQFVPEPGSAQSASFRRNNCCLYYRIPGGGTCGDCVLTRVPTRADRTGGASSTAERSRT